MEQVFAEAERELETVLGRFADRPRAAVVQLLLMALEREEIVSMAYREAQIADRLRRTKLPDDVRKLIEHAVIWIWKDEEMHAVYARGALMRLGGPWLRLRALCQQTGGILAGWATSVLHHAGWGRAAAGVRAGQIDHAQRPHRRQGPSRGRTAASFPAVSEILPAQRGAGKGLLDVLGPAGLALGKPADDAGDDPRLSPRRPGRDSAPARI